LLQEAQSQYILQKEQNEKLSKEKTDELNDLQSLKTHLTSEIDKLNYDKKEQELKIETLLTENKHLQQEIAEMSGDYDNQQGGKAKARPIVAGGGSTTVLQTPEMSKNVSRSNLNNNETTTPSHTLTDSAGAITSSQGIALLQSNNSAATAVTFTANVTGASGTTPIIATPLTRDTLDQEVALELVKLSQKHDISSNIITEISDMIKVYVTSRLSLLLSDYETRINRDKQLILDYNRKLQDSHSQRIRLENDLSEQLLKYSKLLFDVDVLKGMDGINKTDYFTNRERANSRSLQQRLEQVCM
jgi:hypothetical protein